MKITDYPKTLELLQKEIRSIASIRPSHGGFMAALNKVRIGQGLNAIDLDELVLATLSRVEDKLDATQNEVRAKARAKSSDEQKDSSDTSSKETTH